MRPLHEGDTVTITMTEWVFPFQPGGTGFYLFESARVLHTPCDVGDYWAFEWEGTTFTINPNCAAFAGVVLEKDESEVTG